MGRQSVDHFLECVDRVIKLKTDFINNVPGGLNIRVLNMSLGGTGQSAIERAAFDTLTNQLGVHCVASAGNDGRINGLPPVNYPGGYDPVTCVGSVDARLLRSDFSSYGPHVEISAPGSNILSTVPDNGCKYAYFDGTSMASPVLCGCIALLLSKNPNLTVQQQKDLIINNAIITGENDRTGTPIKVVDLVKSYQNA